MNLENGFPPNSATQYAGAFFFFSPHGATKKKIGKIIQPLPLCGVRVCLHCVRCAGLLPNRGAGAKTRTEKPQNHLKGQHFCFSK